MTKKEVIIKINNNDIDAIEFSNLKVTDNEQLSIAKSENQNDLKENEVRVVISNLEEGQEYNSLSILINDEEVVIPNFTSEKSLETKIDKDIQKQLDELNAMKEEVEKTGLQQLDVKSSNVKKEKDYSLYSDKPKKKTVEEKHKDKIEKAKEAERKLTEKWIKELEDLEVITQKHEKSLEKVEDIISPFSEVLAKREEETNSAQSLLDEAEKELKDDNMKLEELKVSLLDPEIKPAPKQRLEEQVKELKLKVTGDENRVTRLKKDLAECKTKLNEARKDLGSVNYQAIPINKLITESINNEMAAKDKVLSNLTIKGEKANVLIRAAWKLDDKVSIIKEQLRNAEIGVVDSREVVKKLEHALSIAENHLSIANDVTVKVLTEEFNKAKSNLNKGKKEFFRCEAEVKKINKELNKAIANAAEAHREADLHTEVAYVAQEAARNIEHKIIDELERLTKHKALDEMQKFKLVKEINSLKDKLTKEITLKEDENRPQFIINDELSFSESWVKGMFSNVYWTIYERGFRSRDESYDRFQAEINDERRKFIEEMRTKQAEAERDIAAAKERAEEEIWQAREKAASEAEAARKKAEEEIKTAQDKASNIASSAQAEAQAKKEAAEQAAREAAERAAQEAREAREKADQEAREAREKAAQEAREAREKAASESMSAKERAEFEANLAREEAEAEIARIKEDAENRIAAAKEIQRQKEQELEDEKARAADELFRTKEEASQLLERTKEEASTLLERTKSEANDLLERTKSEAARELHETKSAAAHELSATKEKAYNDLTEAIEKAEKQLEAVKHKADQDLAIANNNTDKMRQLKEEREEMIKQHLLQINEHEVKIAELEGELATTIKLKEIAEKKAQLFEQIQNISNVE